MNSVHSFSTKFHNNGNITVTFYEGTKQRHIKFVKDTKAHSEYFYFYWTIGKELCSPADVATREALEEVRSIFIFKKHPNNPSVFYPAKSRY